MMASMTSVFDRPTFSADWPNFPDLFRQAKRGEAGDGDQRALAMLQARPEPNLPVTVLDGGRIQRAGHRIVRRGITQPRASAVQRFHQRGARGL